eukprot:9599663-Heterocapsa_arctica.AAC.1
MKKEDERREVEIAEFVQEFDESARIAKEAVDKVCHLQEKVGNEIMVLVDSGAYTHVCSRSFADTMPM